MGRVADQSRAKMLLDVMNMMEVGACGRRAALGFKCTEFRTGSCRTVLCLNLIALHSEMQNVRDESALKKGEYLRWAGVEGRVGHSSCRLSPRPSSWLHTLSSSATLVCIAFRGGLHAYVLPIDRTCRRHGLTLFRSAAVIWDDARMDLRLLHSVLQLQIESEYQV